MSPIVQWGPALLVLLGILLGVLYNNRSITHLDKRIDDLGRHQEARHNDLKDFFRSEIRRVEDRIGRLEQPIVRS
jgi:hypothetical protein